MILPGLPFGLTKPTPKLALVASSIASGATVGSLSFETGFSALQNGDTCVVLGFRDGSTTAPTNPTSWTSIATDGGTNTFQAASGRVSYRVIASGFTTPVGVSFTNASTVVCLVLRNVTSLGFIYSKTTNPTAVVTECDDFDALGNPSTLPFSPSKSGDLILSMGGNTVNSATSAGISGIDDATILKEVGLSTSTCFVAGVVAAPDPGLSVAPEFKLSLTSNGVDDRTVHFNLQVR